MIDDDDDDSMQMQARAVRIFTPNGLAVMVASGRRRLSGIGAVSPAVPPMQCTLVQYYAAVARRGRQCRQYGH